MTRVEPPASGAAGHASRPGGGRKSHRALQMDEIDIAIVDEYDEGARAADGGLEICDFMRDPLYLALPARHLRDRRRGCAVRLSRRLLDHGHRGQPPGTGDSAGLPDERVRTARPVELQGLQRHHRPGRGGPWRRHAARPGDPRSTGSGVDPPDRSAPRSSDRLRRPAGAPFPPDDRLGPGRTGPLRRPPTRRRFLARVGRTGPARAGPLAPAAPRTGSTGAAATTCKPGRSCRSRSPAPARRTR